MAEPASSRAQHNSGSTAAGPGPVGPQTFLNQVQSIAIHSQGGGYQEVNVDFTTSESDLTPYGNASGPAFYTFLQGHWIGSYHYDYAAGRFTQALYSLRAGL